MLRFSLPDGATGFYFSLSMWMEKAISVMPTPTARAKEKIVLVDDVFSKRKATMYHSLGSIIRVTSE